MGFLYSMNPIVAEIPSVVEALLQEYAEVFGEPLQLPPMWSYDHHIRLKEGVTPIKIYPYRYLQVQKIGN